MKPHITAATVRVLNGMGPSYWALKWIIVDGDMYYFGGTPQGAYDVWARYHRFHR